MSVKLIYKSILLLLITIINVNSNGKMTRSSEYVVHSINFMNVTFSFNENKNLNINGYDIEDLANKIITNLTKKAHYGGVAKQPFIEIVALDDESNEFKIYFNSYYYYQSSAGSDQKAQYYMFEDSKLAYEVYQKLSLFFYLEKSRNTDPENDKKEK